VVKQITQLLTRAGVVAALVVFLWMVGRSGWQNHTTQLKISELEAKIATMQSDNERMGQLLLYYQTESFKELEARRKLGLKKPDEQAIPVPTLVPQTSDEQPGAAQTVAPSPFANQPIWRQWVRLVLRI
jgi:cell division protein FtsB